MIKNTYCYCYWDFSNTVFTFSKNKIILFVRAYLRDNSTDCNAVSSYSKFIHVYMFSLSWCIQKKQFLTRNNNIHKGIYTTLFKTTFYIMWILLLTKSYRPKHIGTANLPSKCHTDMSDDLSGSACLIIRDAKLFLIRAEDW